MLNSSLKIAIQAALEAGAAIMQVYNTTFDVSYKSDSSPLTKADEEANNIINRYLEPTDIPIISEENKQIDYQIRQQWSSCWIVDPVDGTKEFIKRNGEFTVNIALVKNGKPVFGVIYVPVMQLLYVGDTINQNAFKVKIEAHQFNEELLFKQRQRLMSKIATQNIIVVGSRSHMNTETLTYIESLKSQGCTIEVIAKGSSLKFCALAEGQADVYPRFAPTMEWDTAAGQAICESVGIKVIAKDTNEPLLYNKENLLNPWFIASK